MLIRGQEQPLPKHGACNLGSINLSEFVINPFTSKAHFDTESFVIAVKIAIRALDTVLDENMKNHPLKEQQEMARNFRNVGLGLMGMHDMFIKLGYTYGDKQSIEFADSLADLMFRTAVIESSELAEKKGAFPKYDSRVLSSEIIRKHFTVDELETLGIKKHGLRNCSLLSVAPAGSIGTMLNISTGCEPLFALYYNRKTDSLNGKETYYKVYTGIAKEYIDKHGDKLPEYFNTSKNIKWKDRINMQAALQKHIDTAISSTINLPYEITQEEIEQLYLYAWEKGLKGITIFRDGCKRVGILSTENTKKDKKNNKIVSKNETKSPKIANETEISSELKRGMIIKADDNCIGKKRTLQTGCGTLHCEAFFDPDTGDLLETYLSKGSKGGCLNSLTGLSRLISLSARAGVDIYSIVDQLKSSGTCPSYAVRTATKHDTSTGSSCPVAVGNALLNMYKELQEELFEDTDEKVQNNVEIEKRGKRTEIKPIDEVSNLKTIIPCPECGQPLRFEGGCNTCPECGFSKCD